MKKSKKIAKLEKAWDLVGEVYFSGDLDIRHSLRRARLQIGNALDKLEGRTDDDE